MLFKGHAPRLRTFSLSEVVIPWSLTPRGQLTQLKLACTDENIHSLGDLNQLIDLLVNCPALNILVLDSCLPSQLSASPPAHGRIIDLPHLSRLRLGGSTSCIMNMLKILKLPSSTTLHLDCISKTIHTDSKGLLLLVISAQFRSPVPVEFKSLTVTIFHLGGLLAITASTFPSTLRDRQTQSSEGDIVGNAELVLSFNRLSKPGHSADLLKQVCKLLQISNLKFISMSAVDTVNLNWVELFSRCTNVTTMQVIGRGVSDLVQALTAPTDTNAGSSKVGRKRKHNNRESARVQPASTVAHAHAAIFPELKFLGLAQLNFSDSKHNPSGILFDVFKRGLQQRTATSGAPLKLLRVHGCHISAKRANDLEKLVQDFNWDGFEDYIN